MQRVQAVSLVTVSLQCISPLETLLDFVVVVLRKIPGELSVLS